MNAKRVLFRADGGAALGLGHLMRCRTLALELRRQGWNPVFYSAVEPFPGPLVDETGHPLTIVKVDPAMSEDPGQGADTVKVAREMQVEVIIVDHYGFRTEDFQKIMDAGLPAVCIDDLGNRDLPIDMVINPNPLVTPALYKWQAIPVSLTGEMYTMIRPEILDVQRRAGFHEEGSLFISLGGGDVAGLSLEVLHSIPYDIDRPIVVSISEACPRLLLEIWVATDPSRRGLNVDHRNFPDLLSEAGLAITGGGTTLWELYYIGIPGVAVVWVGNQKHTTSVIRRKQTSLLVDFQAGFDAEAFRGAMMKLLTDPDLRDSMVRNQQALIDGQGARRVSEAIVKRYDR